MSVSDATSSTTGTSSTSSTINDATSSTTNLTNELGLTQESGLASGINWDEIIEAEITQEEEPQNELEDEINGVTTENTQLSAIQTDLQTVAADAEALSDPSLYDDVQAVQSSNSSVVSATATNSLGAVVGSTEISVSQLASAASRTFAYTSPSSATTISIDGASLSISAGESAASVASAINESSSYDVYATTTTDSSGNTDLVLSSRTTGAQTGDYIDATGASGVLTENTALANAGQNAEYQINGGATQSSATDTVTNAIPGVTLTLEGVTTGSDEITITADAPAMNAAAIVSAVQQFVNDYNAAVSLIQSDINTEPASVSDSSSYDPNSGSLFDDVDLESMLTDLRETLSESHGAGIFTQLSQIGISTGESTGAATTSSVEGYLTLDTSKLESAISSNSSSVQSLLQGFSNSMYSTTENYAEASTGTLASRINGNEDEITEMQNRYSTLQAITEANEQEMITEWSNAESEMATLNAEKQSITTIEDAMTSSKSDS